MSKIEDLIRQFCPDGVEYVKLEECCKILDSQRKPVAKGARSNGIYPYYGANGIQDYVSDYIFDGTYVLVGEDGSVITKNGNPVIHWATGKIWVNNHAHILGENDRAILRYLFFILQTLDITPLIHGNIPKLTKGDLKNLEIPLPPLPVQEEIVRILDNFTNLAAELQAELQARQQQYNYYRDTLLSFECREDVQWKKLGELCPLITKQTGFDYSNHIKNKLVREKKEKHIPYIQTKFFTGRQFDFNTDYYIPEETAARFPKIVLDTKCILLSIVGASIGNIGLYDNSQKSFLGGAIGVAKPRADVNTEFIYYYLTSHSGQKQIFHKVKGAGQATITIEDIREFLVPQPSLSEQQRIVDILDRFDTLVNDLSQGLPAEIEARQQQYEYYRDQLLTFKRKEA